jgi:hypothetical protein
MNGVVKQTKNLQLQVNTSTRRNGTEMIGSILTLPKGNCVTFVSVRTKVFKHIYQQVQSRYVRFRVSE